MFLSYIVNTILLFMYVFLFIIYFAILLKRCVNEMECYCSYKIMNTGLSSVVTNDIMLGTGLDIRYSKAGVYIPDGICFTSSNVCFFIFLFLFIYLSFLAHWLYTTNECMQ